MKLVSNQLSPNFTFADSVHAACQILSGQKAAHYNVTHYNIISQHLGTEHFFLTNSARTGLTKILEIVNPPRDKKIGIPAFICAVVATPFLAKGYQIEWLDTDENGVISVPDFERKSDKISMVVVPHIFGQRAPVEEISKIAKPKGIFVIEDGAHLFEPGCETADAKIASFGREKVLSCVSGGAVLWNERSPFANKFVGARFIAPSKSWSIKHALQPLIFALALPWWNAGGRLIPFLAQKIKLLPRAVTEAEKHGEENFPMASLPPAQQKILIRQFQNMNKICEHRKVLAAQWRSILMKLFPEAKVILPHNNFRVTLRTANAENIRKRARKLGFDLREWDGAPIAPRGVNLQKFGYTPGQCPAAETFAKTYVTFPTNIRTDLSDIEKFATLWKN